MYDNIELYILDCMNAVNELKISNFRTFPVLFIQ